MLIRKTILCLFIIIILISFAVPAISAPPPVVGQAAVLIDSKSGQIVFAKNENVPLAPASTTKIVTAIIAIEKSKPTDIVQAGKNATVVEPSAIGLKEGETITMENLLYSLMLKSANDAAVAIAEHISGTVENFGVLMNSRIKDWGATNSNFINPNGLPDSNHFTTAHDLAVITKHAMENPEFRKIVSTKVKVIPRVDDSAGKWLQNHNKMLWRYDGANGVKTGYTNEARQCLVASATKGDQEFIAVILKSEGNNVWTDVKSLLDYGFNNFATYKQKEADSLIQTVKVKNGTGVLQLVTAKEFFYTLPKGEQGTVSEKAEINKEITAPIKKGQVLGKLKFFLQGRELGSVNVVANNEVPVKRFPINKTSISASPTIVGGVLLVLYILWHIRKRKRRRKRLWSSKNAIR